MHTAKCLFAECQKMALGKIHLCRVPEKRHSAKTHFAECRKMALAKIHLCRVPKKNTRQSHFCRVPKKTLGKAVFAECPIKYTRQSFRHSTKCRFPVVNGVPFCWVEWVGWTGAWGWGVKKYFKTSVDPLLKVYV